MNWQKVVNDENRRRKEEGCCVCGRTVNLYYVHVHDSNKLFDVRDWYRIFRKQGGPAVVNEMKKCAIVCNWCRKEIEAGDEFIPVEEEWRAEIPKQPLTVLNVKV